MGTPRGGLVVPTPARVRHDVAGIGRMLVTDEVREQVLDFGDAQRDGRRPRWAPFLCGRCRARIAARNA